MSPFHRQLPILVLVSVGVSFLLSIQPFIIKVPVYDDYDAIISFTLQSKESLSLWDNVRMIFSQHNEHSVVSLKVLTLICYFLTGKIIFSTYFWTSCWLLFATFLTLIVGSSNVRASMVSAACGLPIVFNLKIYQSLLSPSVSIPTVTTYFLGAISIVLALRPGRIALISALLLMSIASFCQGNGLLLGPSISIILFLRGQTKPGAIWLGSSCIVAAFYAIGSGELSRVIFFQHGNYQRIFDIADYSIVFIGTSFSESNPQSAFISGIMLMMLILGLVKVRIWQLAPEWTTFLLFILGGIMANSLVRSVNGVEYPAYQHRYYLMSSTLAAVVFILTSRAVWNGYGYAFQLKVLMLLGTIHCLIMNCSYPWVASLYKQQIQNMYIQHAAGPGKLPYPNQERAESLLSKAVSENIIIISEF